ncbi:hypothetical protein D3C72_2058640 [compost metagenome]
MGLVKLALRFFALLLAGQQLLAEAGQLLLQRGFALLQRVDLAAQGDDLAFAQQRALLGRPRPRHPHPAIAKAFATAGDDRIAVGQRGLQCTRGIKVFGRMQACQQAADRGGALDLGGQ